MLSRLSLFLVCILPASAPCYAQGDSDGLLIAAQKLAVVIDAATNACQFDTPPGLRTTISIIAKNIQHARGQSDDEMERVYKDTLDRAEPGLCDRVHSDYADMATMITVLYVSLARQYHMDPLH